LSALPAASVSGSDEVSAWVCRNSRPVASRLPSLSSGDALLDAAFHVGDHRVERAAHLARVARDLRHALLVVVEFLERDDRQEDVVLGEAEQARRVVHQHVGVEHEQLAVSSQKGHEGRGGKAEQERRAVVADRHAGKAGTGSIQSALTAASTSSTWPGTLTPRHSRRSTSDRRR
jgi:hypothetical protein